MKYLLLTSLFIFNSCATSPESCATSPESTDNNPFICVSYLNAYIVNGVFMQRYECWTDISTVQCSAEVSEDNYSYVYDGTGYSSCSEWCDENEGSKECRIK